MSETAVSRYEKIGVQEECLDAIKQARALGSERGLINMAMGLGKTYVAARDVSDFLQDQPDARVLYLCNRDHILQQAKQTFDEVLGPQVEHGYLFGGMAEDQAQVVYATFQTLNSPFSNGRVYQAFDPKEFNYIVADESHHGQAPTHRAILDHFQPNFLLGMTATPNRRDGRDITEIFGPELYRKSLEEALAEGLLTPVKYVTYMDHVREFGELEGITLEELNKKVFIPLRDDEIAEVIFNQAAKLQTPHGLIFCASIEHAERMAKLLPSIAAIHSRLPNATQQELRESFKAGEFAFAAVVDQFNEGYDFPAVNMEVFLRTTTSQRIYEQQLGRGLRRAEGKDEVIVIDLAADPRRIQTIVTLQKKVSEAQKRLNIISDLDTAVKFEFSQEAQQVVNILEEIDRKARLRQAAINALMPSLPVEQTSLKVHHPEADVTREMVLPREAMLVIDKIFTSPSGRVDLKTLTDAHKAYFRTPVKQKEMHGYLEEMMRNWLIDYCVHLRSKQGHDYWRLTPRTTDSLRRTEPYESYFKNSFTNFKSVVDDIFAQGTLHDYEWRGEDNHKPYRIVRMVNSPNSLPVSELRNEFGKITVTPCSIEWPQALLGESDITAYELFSDLGATTKDGINRHQNQVESEITLKEDCVEERLRVLAASAIGYYPDEIIRILPPGEMDTIRKKLESLMIDPYNSH